MSENNNSNHTNEDSLDDKQPILMDFATLQKMVQKNLNDPSRERKRNTKYTKEQIVNFMKNPEVNQDNLREVSRYLYSFSPQYKRLINYFSNMLTFDYVVKPIKLNQNRLTSEKNREKLKRDTIKTFDLIENMNLSHELNKVCKVLFKEDVFYGYELEDDKSYFIQMLDPDYCRISSIEDGVFNYSFDFSYFDNPKNKEKLNHYPDEFKTKYRLYQRNKNMKWIEIDSDKSVCFKLNDEMSYPIPPFATVFPSVFEIEEYRELEKEKSKIDNYEILTQKVPIYDKDGEPNKFLIDMETVMFFHNRAANSLPDEVGLLTSPMDIASIKFNKDRMEVDGVTQAKKDYYDSAGVSQIIFNSDNTSSVGLGKSIITDEEIVFSLLRQFERWVNRKLKKRSGTNKFQIKFLDITRFNRKEVFESNLKGAQFGVVGKFEVAASNGVSPSELVNMNYLEEDIFKLSDKLTPLKSSHTSSGNKTSERGAPEKSDDELTDSGVTTRDQDSNNNR